MYQEKSGNPGYGYSGKWISIPVSEVSYLNGVLSLRTDTFAPQNSLRLQKSLHFCTFGDKFALLVIRKCTI
jgi:hypothetical protein